MRTIVIVGLTSGVVRQKMAFVKKKAVAVGVLARRSLL